MELSMKTTLALKKTEPFQSIGVGSNANILRQMGGVRTLTCAILSTDYK
jgi:hypothetical protein